MEDPAEAAGCPAPEEQNGNNQSQRSENLRTQTVLNLLSGVNSGLQVRQQAVPAHIQVPLQSLIQVVENPYGEGYTTEVQAPTLDQDLLEDSTLSPSATPELLIDQAFQTKPFEDVDEPTFVHEADRTNSH